MKIDEAIILDECVDLIELRKQLKSAKDSFCLNCGCADPLNMWEVCFICGKVPYIKSLKGLKKVIKGWLKWSFK